MWVILQNNAGWDCFKTPILREILRTQKYTSGGTLCVFGSHTFVPISWMCKKQTSVSHSSTESEIISLDAGLRLDGIPALDLWDLIVLVLGNTTQNHNRTVRPVVCPQTNHGRQRSRRVINDLDNVDLVPSNVQFSHQEALLYVFEDNEALIKMIINGRSPTIVEERLLSLDPISSAAVRRALVYLTSGKMKRRRKCWKLKMKKRRKVKLMKRSRKSERTVNSCMRHGDDHEME